MGSEPLTLKDVTGKTYNAQMVSGINPIEGTDEFARISDDGKRIERFSFKTGELTGVLFDSEKTTAGTGEKDNVASQETCNGNGTTTLTIDDYVLSPDGKRLLLQTATQPVYRRSFKADFYLYDTVTKTLRRLSKTGREQVPTFSPDSH